MPLRPRASPIATASSEVQRARTRYIALADIEPESDGFYLDKTFAWETKYDYRITSVTLVHSQGVNMAVEGDDSKPVETFTRDIYPPAEPTGLQAVFSSVGQKPFIDLTWAPNMESDLAGYNVFRRVGGGEPVKLNQQLVPVPSFRDESVRAGQDLRLLCLGGGLARQRKPALSRNHRSCSRQAIMEPPMRFCRYQFDNAVRYGLIESTVSRSGFHSRHSDELPAGASDFERGAPVEIPLTSVRLLAPVIPSKIVCIGRNYREHAKELNHPIPTEPLIFLKPPSAVLAPGGTIFRPTSLSQRVDHEGELGVVIGKRCHGLREGDDVRDYILGYTCVNDVTARDLQNKDGQWSRAKGFDTFCPIGPVVVSGLDPWKGVRVQTRVNGQIRQDGTTADFLFPARRYYALYLAGDDARTRRRYRHRNSCRGQSVTGRRYSRSHRRGRRNASQTRSLMPVVGALRAATALRSARNSNIPIRAMLCTTSS